MPPNSHAKGSQTERDVVNFLRNNGFPNVSRSRIVLGAHGVRQFSDVLGIKGVNIEVKNRVNVNIGQSLQQATDGDNVPTVVIKPYGVSRAGKFWAVMYLEDMVKLWVPTVDS